MSLIIIFNPGNRYVIHLMSYLNDKSNYKKKILLLYSLYKLFQLVYNRFNILAHNLLHFFKSGYIQNIHILLLSGEYNLQDSILNHNILGCTVFYMGDHIKDLRWFYFLLSWTFIIFLNCINWMFFNNFINCLYKIIFITDK